MMLIVYDYQSKVDNLHSMGYFGDTFLILEYLLCEHVCPLDSGLRVMSDICIQYYSAIVTL